MTSISATSSSSYLSPLQKLQDETAVGSKTPGAIGFVRSKARCPPALTDINASLQGSQADDAAIGTNLIARRSQIEDRQPDRRRVSGGKLTSDQATELQGVFKAGFANGAGGAAGPGGAGAAPHGHHRGPWRPPAH